MGNVRLTKNGITYKNNNTSVYLDPKTVQNGGINFVSHAHIDHLPNGGSGFHLILRTTWRIFHLLTVVIS